MQKSAEKTEKTGVILEVPSLGTGPIREITVGRCDGTNAVVG
jgi:hypothetical protein